MAERQPLTTSALTLRLMIDFALLTFGFWCLLTDLGSHDSAWAVFDGTFLAAFGWLTFTDVHNWKDPSQRLTPVRRPKS